MTPKIPLRREEEHWSLLRSSCLLGDSPTCLDSSIVENVLEREQECRGKNRLGDLGCDTFKVLAYDEQESMVISNVPP